MHKLFGFISPAYAIEYDSFQNSINQAFSNEATSKDNIMNLFLVAIFIVIVSLIFRHLMKQEEQKMAQNRLSGFKINKSDAKRQFYRAPVEKEILWSYEERNNDHNKDKSRGSGKVTGKQKFYNDVVINISGGGLCFRTEQVLKQGDKINILLDVGESEPLVLPSKVVRPIPVVFDEADMYEVAVMFDSLKTGLQDKVVKYVMSYQRDYIRNIKHRSQQQEDEDEKNFEVVNPSDDQEVEDTEENYQGFQVEEEEEEAGKNQEV